ncbi:hypothetical protein D3H64_09350 [Atopobacter sp. AH10]|uniref:hypothetical protein n=1 Tax=Atopobacter sp. AH10 TaxID=2315861 RepID=UPI000EF25BF4|nr:hypothetical protein [Atopobacter sp. AH10]RLK62536.1 hypothetical protein D3H64_09350 [Atopobacter sp. AH10]
MVMRSMDKLGERLFTLLRIDGKAKKWRVLDKLILENLSLKSIGLFNFFLLIFWGTLLFIYFSPIAYFFRKFLFLMIALPDNGVKTCKEKEDDEEIKMCLQ